MDVLKFNERVKQGRLDLHPSVAYGFEDPDAKPFFVDAWGVASVVGDPADVVISIDELDIDPETVWGFGPNKGEPMMPERAAAVRAAREASGQE